MCGIIGFISEKTFDLNKGLHAIHHRGPDAFGVFHQGYVHLGHKRLSIIDLEETSNQPMYIDAYVLVYNGEIYNYKELKAILIGKGIRFKTNGDTEVLLQWIRTEGIAALNQVNGMFAFALFNKETGEVILGRDALGIKPLYVYESEESLLFCSEIKGIFAMCPEVRQIDRSLISEFLLNGFIYGSETGFKNIRKIAPGSYEIFSDQGKKLQTDFFWNLSAIASAKKEGSPFKKSIDKSIDQHLVSDVPVGLFFSGGIDSSIILSQTRTKILPITVKSSEHEYRDSGISSDYAYAKKIAKKFQVPIEEVSLEDSINSNEDFLRAVEAVVSGNEELMYDFTYTSSLALSQAARKRNLIVMLSGLGADEIFAGYPRYRLVKYDRLFKIFLPLVALLGKRNKWLAKKVDRFRAYYSEGEFSLKYAALVGVFSSKEVAALVDDDHEIIAFISKIDTILAPVAMHSNLKKAIYLDFFGFLAHNFAVADKSSMQASIELRVPLATKELYESTWSLPDTALLSFFRAKKPLRDYLLEVLPKQLVDRTKAGFNPPLDGYINNLGAQRIAEVYATNGLYDFLNKGHVEKIIADHFSLKHNNTFKLYQLVYLSFWLKNYK